MTDPDVPPPSASHERRAPTPGAAWGPGVLLVFLGLWAASEGELVNLGWGLFSMGLALVLIGGVAQGVAWGMDLHEDRHPRP